MKVLIRVQHILNCFSVEQVWIMFYLISTGVVWCVDNATVLKVMACAGWCVALFALRHCYFCKQEQKNFSAKISSEPKLEH